VEYPDGSYNITVFANDSVMNSRIRFNYFIIDRTFPGLELLAPEDGDNSSSDTLLFNFTATDNMDSNLTCNITINGTLYDSEFGALDGEITSVNVSGLDEGIHFWNITCWDDAGNVNRSETREITIDTSRPIVKLINPEDNTWNNSDSILFSYNATDTYTDIVECSLIFNGQVNQTNSSINESGVNTFIVYSPTEQQYNWTVNCTDSVGYVGNDSVRILYADRTSPTVNITTLNSTWINDSTPEILFNITDNLDGVLNYTFYIDSVYQSTNGTAISGRNSTDSLTYLENGSYRIILEAWDEINGRVNSSEITIFIDTEKPEIFLMEPPNYSNKTQNVDLVFNATDNMDINLTCNVTLNGIINQSDLNVSNGTIVNISLLNIETGLYNWSVLCRDDALNTRISDTWYFTVTPPDLYINGSEIEFNNSNPKEGENVSINITVRNIGTADVLNALINIYHGDPAAGGIQIDSKTVNVPFGGYVKINTTWISEIGTHYMFAWADPADSVSEIRENNNIGNNSIMISSWHTIYGISVGDLLISDPDNQTVFSWYVTNSTSGNIYVVDYESSVSWSNLTAVGRDISNNPTSDDFEEIDDALNSVNFSDSVNRTFTNDSVPKHNDSFIVFRQTIGDVAIVNSTNSSNFITGVLWDKSDTSTTEYDGDEDLIFVSKIRDDKQGGYGVYDYEIRVPSELKKYKTTDVYSVVFYIELR
jgi:hypothetical protein